jgi:hypothetical protein
MPRSNAWHFFLITFFKICCDSFVTSKSKIVQAIFVFIKHIIDVKGHHIYTSSLCLHT